MKTRHAIIARWLLAGLASSMMIALLPAAGAWASEMESTFVEPEVVLPPADAFLADAAGRSALGGEGSLSETEVNNVDREGSVDPEAEADSSRTSSLTMWLPTIASLPRVDSPMVDPYLIAVGAIRSATAARMVCNTVWGLEAPESADIDIGLPPVVGDLTERDSLAAAEVAFVLGNIETPDPDIVFLAFVAVQSLWGLICRPRQN